MQRIVVRVFGGILLAVCVSCYVLLNVQVCYNLFSQLLGGLFKRRVLYARVGYGGLADKEYQLSVVRQGRLGNNMWQYSALYGLANLTNRAAILSTDFRNLENAFNLWMSRNKHQMSTASFYLYEQRDLEMPYDVEQTRQALMRINDDIMLRGYFQHYRYFAHVANEIRKQFTFRYRIKRQVSAIFQRYRLTADDVVKVGIHVRRGDSLVPHSVNNGFGPPDLAYFKNAMDYFRKKYTRVRFVVCSDDLKWSRRHLTAADVTIVPNHAPEVDMAILTSCDHVIISNGTFSWWVGWLCTGITVRYKGIPKRNSLLYNMTLGEHWPPNDAYNHYVAIDAN